MYIKNQPVYFLLDGNNSGCIFCTVQFSYNMQYVRYQSKLFFTFQIKSYLCLLTDYAFYNFQCSLDKSAFGRCFASRRSNESQCPMLSGKAAMKNTTKRKSRTGLLTSIKTSPSTNTNQKKLRFQLAKERKASTTLGIIMSAFTICWFPFFVLALVRPFLNPNSGTLKTVSGLFLWLGYANSLLNPIIYATLNRDFRKPFQVDILAWIWLVGLRGNCVFFFCLGYIILSLWKFESYDAGGILS